MEGWLPASHLLERGVKCDFDVGDDDGDDGGVLLLSMCIVTSRSSTKA